MSPILLGVLIGLSFAAGIGYGHWRARQVIRRELNLWRLRHDRALGRRRHDRSWPS